MIGLGMTAPRSAADRPLLIPLIRAGDVVGREPLSAARARHDAARAELPVTALQMSRSEPAIPTIYQED